MDPVGKLVLDQNLVLVLGVRASTMRHVQHLLTSVDLAHQGVPHVAVSPDVVGLILWVTSALDCTGRNVPIGSMLPLQVDTVAWGWVEGGREEVKKV